MALQRCFRAEDLIPYRPWPPATVPPLVAYNTTLIKTPRVYQEEPESFSGAHLGALWTRAEQTPWGTSVVNFMATTRQVAWPGWNVVRWKFDGQYGRYLGRSEFQNFSGVTAGQFAFEPSGFLWGFAANPLDAGFDAVVMDEATMSYTAGLGALLSADFETGSGGATIAFEDMNVDRAADRLFVRWTANAAGQVSVYELSSKRWLADIYTPNRTAGIVLAPEGFAYVVDVNDWICVYDYDGAFHNAFRNPRRADYPGGFCYGWDKFYKRLLFLPGLANATDGSSRLRVQGYYPVPEAAVLTPPIPRQVPRKGRTVRFVSHLCGEGGEPLGARRITSSGLIASSVVTDKEGDAVVQATAGATGSASLALDADASTTPADPTEPDRTTEGRTLVVEWVSPTAGAVWASGATVTATVHVTGAAGEITLTVYGKAPLASVQHAGTGYDPSALSVTFAMPTTGSSSYLPAVWTALVQDSAGNTGQTEQIQTNGS